MDEDSGSGPRTARHLNKTLVWPRDPRAYEKQANVVLAEEMHKDLCADENACSGPP